MKMLLPRGNEYISGRVALFDDLVCEGETRSGIPLSYELHIFLVQCLLEYLTDSSVLNEVLSLRLFSNAIRRGEEANLLLKRTGDEALLLAGLFPRRARRLNVGPSYFRTIGEEAYSALGSRCQATGTVERGLFYRRLAYGFRFLVEVLHGTRTGSRTAWQQYFRFQANF